MRLSRGCLKNSVSQSRDEISRDRRLAWLVIISNDAQTAREYIYLSEHYYYLAHVSANNTFVQLIMHLTRGAASIRQSAFAVVAAAAAANCNRNCTEKPSSNCI